VGKAPKYVKKIRISRAVEKKRLPERCEKVSKNGPAQSVRRKQTAKKFSFGVMKSMPKTVTLGRNQRLSFSKIEEIQSMPNLIEIQKKSYQWFIEQGLKEVFDDVAYISDYAGNLVLKFIDYKMEDTPKYTVMECKERDATYAAPLKVRVQLVNRETMEVKEQEEHSGLKDIPDSNIQIQFI